MSRVYFHSPSGTAELHGSERAYGAGICDQMALSALRYVIDPFDGPSPLEEWLPKDSYVRDPTRRGRSFADSFETWWRVSGGFLTNPATGDRYDPFQVTLNTAIVAGSDPIRLLARIHGSCELHGYVEGPDRRWLADIIVRGLAHRIYRPNAGWQSVIEHLLSRDDEPVVMSYSVSESFPHSWIVSDSGIRTADQVRETIWYEELTGRERWALALQALRKLDEHRRFRMRPSTFSYQGFLDGISAFDLVHLTREA